MKTHNGLERARYHSCVAQTNENENENVNGRTHLNFSELKKKKHNFEARAIEIVQMVFLFLKVLFINYN